MNIKKCSNCGYEMAGETRNRKCPECGTMFKMGYCSICKKWSEKIREGRCRECEDRQHKEWRERRRGTGANRLENWLARIRKIPTPYKTLTEDEWMNACKHFGGCAYCGSQKIDSRSMFIAAKQGGRYCSWNVVPACEECETINLQTKNPFLFMDNKYNRTYMAAARKYNFSLERLLKIVEYLGGKIDESMQNKTE